MPIHTGKRPACCESDNPSSGWVPPDPSANSHAGQHLHKDGPFEVFWADEAMVKTWADEARDATCFHEATAIEEAGPGWYWWPCHPGCLPDRDPCGPFATSQAAWLDAQGEG